MNKLKIYAMGFAVAAGSLFLTGCDETEVGQLGGYVDTKVQVSPNGTYKGTVQVGASASVLDKLLGTFKFETIGEVTRTDAPLKPPVTDTIFKADVEWTKDWSKYFKTTVDVKVDSAGNMSAEAKASYYFKK